MKVYLSRLRDMTISGFRITFISTSGSKAAEELGSFFDVDIFYTTDSSEWRGIKAALFSGSHEVYRKKSFPSTDEIFEIAIKPSLTENVLFHQLGTDRTVLQQHKNDCAAAATSMLLKRHGIEVEDGDIFDALDPGLHGAPISLLQIQSFLSSVGIQSGGYRGTLKDLRSVKLPALLHTDKNHFVILSQILGEGGIVVDPALGRQYWSNAHFDSRWDGIFFALEN